MGGPVWSIRTRLVKAWRLHDDFPTSSSHNVSCLPLPLRARLMEEGETTEEEEEVEEDVGEEDED